MGHEHQYLLETKKFVWFVAVIFAVLMMFQYFEFPYGDVVSSLFSASKAQTVVNGTYPSEPSTEIPQVSSNITHVYTPNTSNVENSILQVNISPASSPIPATLLSPISDPTIVSDPDTSKPDRDSSKSVQGLEEHEVLRKNPVKSDNTSSANGVPSMGEVVTISEMHDMLVRNRALSRSTVVNFFFSINCIKR